MAKSLDLTMMSLLVICLAISVGTSYAHDSPAAGPSGEQGGSNNEQFEVTVEKELQVSFQLIEQGKKSEAEMKLQDLGRAIMTGYPSMTVEEKLSKLSEIAMKIKKSLKVETQASVDEWLGGVQVGLKLSLGGKSFQKSIFEKLIEQKLRLAFQTIEHGNPAKGKKMLEVLGDLVDGYKGMSKKEKLSLMSQITLKIKPSLNKETQADAEEYAAGVKFGAQFITNPEETGDQESAEAPSPN